MPNTACQTEFILFLQMISLIDKGRCGSIWFSVMILSLFSIFLNTCRRLQSPWKVQLTLDQSVNKTTCKKLLYKGSNQDYWAGGLKKNGTAHCKAVQIWIGNGALTSKVWDYSLENSLGIKMDKTTEMINHSCCHLLWHVDVMLPFEIYAIEKWRLEMPCWKLIIGIQHLSMTTENISEKGKWCGTWGLGKEWQKLSWNVEIGPLLCGSIRKCCLDQLQIQIFESLSSDGLFFTCFHSENMIVLQYK